MVTRGMATAVVAAALWAGTLGASLANAAPTLTLGTGTDPTESITTQVTASGVSEDKQSSPTVTVKSTGGRECGANPFADEESGGSVLFGGEDVSEGSFSHSVNHTFETAGSYLLCGWLTDGAQGGAVVATASLTVSVRLPHLSLAFTAPTTVAAGQAFQVVTTAQAEVRRPVTAFILPSTGRGCPANSSAAPNGSGANLLAFPGQSSTTWNVAGGPFAEVSNLTIQSAGAYMLCGYIQYPSSESPPEMTAGASITATAPPPPCVVPTFTSLTTLGAIEHALDVGGCAVGSIKRVASRKVRAGRVVALNHVAGTRLAAGTGITITISTGPPCIVPHVSPGTTLARTESRLLANHCAVGKLGSARSHHIRRGRVLRLAARSGQLLPSHTPVAIVLAKRRR
jgi:hypothetical protein